MQSEQIYGDKMLGLTLGDQALREGSDSHSHFDDYLVLGKQRQNSITIGEDAGIGEEVGRQPLAGQQIDHPRRHDGPLQANRRVMQWLTLHSVPRVVPTAATYLSSPGQ